MAVLNQNDIKQILATYDDWWAQRLENILGTILNANYSETFSPKLNSFYDSLVNRISRTMIRGPPTFRDVFGRFTGPVLEEGETIQIINTRLIKAQNYDEDSTNPFTAQKNVPGVEYHSLNESLQYALKTGYQNVKRAVTNAQTLGDLMAKDLEVMEKSRRADQKLTWLKFICDPAKYDASTGLITLVNNETDYEKINDQIWTVVTDMQDMTEKFNQRQEATQTDTVVLFIQKDFKHRMDTALAKIYHTDVFTFPNTEVVPMASFMKAKISGVDRNIAAIAVSPDTLQYFPRNPQVESIRDPKSLMTHRYATYQGIYTFLRMTPAAMFLFPASA